MCGIPFHAADTYINRLIERGHKVAICEQVEDPKKAKGLVKRDCYPCGYSWNYFGCNFFG